jgi:hypothetical protein
MIPADITLLVVDNILDLFGCKDLIDLAGCKEN